MADSFERVYGTEMEYPADVLWAEAKEYKQLDATAELKNILPPGLVATGVNNTGDMLSNGGRYYLDCGSHVEYATPEDTSIWGTVAGEYAGERIVTHGFETYINKRQDIRRGMIEKRVYDDQRVTWGYHINMSADGSVIPTPNGSAYPDVMRLLALHLATDKLYTGAGTLYKDGQNTTQFSLAQKSLGLTCDFTTGTLNNNKPVLNQRDENHAPNTGLRRIHITSEDPNVSPWATWMTIGTSSLVVRAIEQGKTDRGALRVQKLGVNATYKALTYQTATDLTFSKKIELENGKRLTALEIQKCLFEIACRTSYTDVEGEVLGEWERALADMERDPMLLRDRSGAIAKYDLMQRWMAKHDVSLGHDGIRAIDHSIGTLFFRNKDHVPSPKHPVPPEPMTAKLRGNHWKSWMPSKDEITGRVSAPPTTTRAFERGKAIETGKVSSAAWHNYNLDGKVVAIHHPLEFDADIETKLAS